MRYATRNHAFTSACTWVLEGDRLLRDDGAGPPHVFALREVVRCTLDFRPTRADRNCFRCRLTFRNAMRIEVLNRTWKGPMNFADTSADYVAFVRALVAALAVHAPQCDFRAGTSWLHYVINLLATAFIGVCLVAMGLLLAKVGLTWMVAIKIFFVLFYLPALFLWVGRNRPRLFSPGTIPGDILPAVSGTKTTPPNQP